MDEYSKTCYPSGGSRQNIDDIGRRTGNGKCTCSLGGAIPAARGGKSLDIDLVLKSLLPSLAHLLARHNATVAPTEKMAELLKKTVAEARAVVSKDKAKNRIPLTQQEVDDAIAAVKGSVMIVYPMGLPPYDEVRSRYLNPTLFVLGRVSAALGNDPHRTRAGLTSMNPRSLGPSDSGRHGESIRSPGMQAVI